MKRTVIRILLSLFVIALIRAGYRFVAAWHDSPYSAENLRAASGEINKLLPASVGTEMQLVHTSATEGRFVYELRLVNDKRTGQAINSESTRQEMRKVACGNEQARDMLRHQVRLLFQIAASDGRPVASIEIVP